MFKLPKCPYCKTVYRYKDTKEALKNVDNECYHCHKKFKAKRFPQILVLLLIIILPCIGFNILLLTQMRFLDFWSILILLVITIIFLVIGYFLIPFFVNFKKTETEKKTELRWRV